MVTIVTEGISDKLILEKILSDLKGKDRKFRIVSGFGNISAMEMAEDLAHKTRDRMVLVLDADTNDEEEIKIMRQQLGRRFVNRVLGRNFEIILFRPNIEKIFESKHDLFRVSSGGPARVNFHYMLKELSENDLLKVRKIPEVQKLRNFMTNEL